MPTRTRWARAAIAAGSLAGVIAAIVFAHLFLPTGAARLISLVIAVSWAIILVVTWVVWSTLPGGSRKLRLPLAATVLGTLAAITVISTAPEAILAQVGRPTEATVVAERVEALGGSGAYRYTLQDGNGKPIPGEIHDSFDTYNVGDEVWVVTDPRGIVTADEVPTVDAPRWRTVTGAFSAVALAAGALGILLCFLAGYFALGPYLLRKVRWKFRR